MGATNDNLEIWNRMRIWACPDISCEFGMGDGTCQLDEPASGRTAAPGRFLFRSALSLRVHRMGTLRALFGGGDPLGTASPSRLGLPLSDKRAAGTVTGSR